ncbi:MAG: phage terminase small subunit P27 family [Allosphingosinicella sp.]
MIEGNPGKRRLNKNEPKPPVSRPEAPAWLSVEAKTEWWRVVSRLADIGMMTDLDVGLLAAYCDAFGTWQQARLALERVAAADASTRGLVIRTQKGNFIQNPLLGIVNTSMQLMKSFACEFGMSPAVRSRLDVEIAAKGPDAAAKEGVDRFFG